MGCARDRRGQQRARRVRNTCCGGNFRRTSLHRAGLIRIRQRTDAHRRGNRARTRRRAAARNFAIGYGTSCARAANPLSSPRGFNRFTHGRNYQTRAGITAGASRRRRGREQCDGRRRRASSLCRVALLRAPSYFHRTISPAANNTSHHASTEPTNTRSRNPTSSNDRGRSATSTSQRHADRRAIDLLV